MMELTQAEEKIMFHTLGYSFQPGWNETRTENRNWFGINPDTEDHLIIQKLVEKGYMRKSGNTPWGEEIFSVTDIGISYVTDLWLRKKKENKPNRSKRRYQAFLAWTEGFSGNFKDFLDWLCVTEEMRLYSPKEVDVIEDFKRRWNI